MTTIPDHLSWIDGWLKTWARWVGGDRKEIRRMVGCKSPNWLQSGGASTGETFDQMYDREENKQCLVIDSILRHLTPQYWMAIQMHYCRMEGKHRGDRQEVLEAALELIQREAIRKGVDMANAPKTGHVRRVA